MLDLRVGAGLSLTVCPGLSLLSFGAERSGLLAAYHWLAESRSRGLVVFLIILGVDLAEVLVLLLECLLLVLAAVFVVVFCAVLVTGSLRAARTLPLASRSSRIVNCNDDVRRSSAAAVCLVVSSLVC